MVDFVGLMSGFNEREKENVASRKDMAKAFADFKAANPYASAAEFQSFIDSYSGGRNYIAGGAPGSEIITALGQRNEETRAADLLRQQVSDASARSGLIADITGRAEQYLLGLPKPENAPIDYSQAASDFYGTLGIDEAAAKSFFGDQPLTSIFNESNRNRLVLNDIREKTPEFLELVKASGGYGSDEAFKKAREAMGIPDYMVSPMRARVKQELEDEQIELRDSRRERLLKRAQQGIADGNKNIAALIEGDAKNFGFDMTSSESKAYLKDIEAEAVKTYNDEQLLLQEARFDSLIAFAERQIKLGNASTLPNTLSTKAKTLGLDVNTTGYEQFSQEVIAEAQRNRDIEDTNLTRQRNTEDAQASAAFGSSLANDADLNRMIERGDLAGAKARIQQMTDAFANTDIHGRLVNEADSFINARLAYLEAEQDNKIGALRMASNAAKLEARDEYKTSNIAKAENYFTAFAKDGVNPNAGIHKGNAAMAAMELAKEYNMSPTVLALMTDAFNAVPEGATPADLIVAGRNAISGYAQPFAASQAAFADAAGTGTGYLGNDQTVASWRQATEKGITEHVEKIDAQITKVKNLQNASPEDKITMLQGVQARLQEGFVRINNAIRTADEYAQSDDRWVTVGTPMFDLNEQYFSQGGLKPMIDGSTKMISDRIAAEMEALKAQIAQNPTPKSGTTVLNPDPSKPSALSQGITSIVDKAEKARVLEGISTDTGSKSSAIGSIFNDPDTQMYNRIIKQFITADDVRDRLMRPENQAEFDAFVADPFAYIYNSDYGQKWLNSQGQEFKDFTLQP